jgi:hypothetical protein
MNNPYIYLHIPKTGGTTLRDIIYRQYKKDQILTIKTLKESAQIHKDITSTNYNHLKIIQGHLKYGFHNNVNIRPAYFTILRNPVERVLSTYYYVLSNRNNPQNLSTLGKQMSIYEFIESGINPFVLNGQTQLISGITGSIDNPIIQSEELYTLAKKNIENHFLFLGITEMFDESILILKDLLGWHMPYYSFANRTKKKTNYDAINPKVISFIKEYNQLDIRLYNFAKTTLLNRMEEDNNNIRGRISKFKKINKLMIPFFGYSRAIRLIRKYF